MLCLFIKLINFALRLELTQFIRNCQQFSSRASSILLLMNILISSRNCCQFIITILLQFPMKDCKWTNRVGTTCQRFWRESIEKNVGMSRRCGWSDTKVGNARETCTFIPEDILHKQKQHMAATSDKRNVGETYVPWEISWKRYMFLTSNPDRSRTNFRYVGRQSLQLRWLRWHRAPRSD